MSSSSYKKPFKLHKLALDFFLGAGISACIYFYKDADINLFRLAVYAILWGGVSIVAIESIKYAIRYIKRARRRMKRIAKGKIYKRRPADKDQGKITW